MQNVIFSAQQGEGMILGPNDRLLLGEEPIEVGEHVIRQGEKTTLLGFFSRPITYVGKHKDKYVFYLGDSNGYHYYQTLSVISKTRIYLNYSWNSGRDWNLVKGKWK